MIHNEACGRMTTDANHRILAVIAMLAAGMDDYITKPIVIDPLVQALL